jgi:HEPN domain-containing protein
VIADAYKDAGDASFELTISPQYVGHIVVPCVFLYFRCVELLLKSVLVFHGIAERDITRTLGHRVSALLDRADAFPQFKAVGLSADDRRLIHQFSDVYSDKWFEYPEDSLAAYPELATLKELATRLCDRVRTYEEPKA